MKLEKITLNGFKSFADKTEFAFGSGVTAIVGPNGCGKSNVVDALKWVLGDQSPKSLRSGQMTDVIFSGSGSRKPSGMAEVSLHFVDVVTPETDGELTVSRRLYRSGESEYLINNKSCRLKDIRELFMDTGVGVRAYSIIEQGQIDQLLHASKTDRRVIFEEAAGISKYKAHKKEALRKLDRTEQNLLRLADIVSEVQRQLRSVKLAAGKARNYLEYSDRLKQLRVQYSLAEYDKIHQQMRASRQELGQLEEVFSGVVSEVARNDARQSELAKEILATEGEIHRWDNSLVSARSKIEQQFERIEFLRSRLEELGRRMEQANQQIRQSQHQQQAFLTQVQDVRREEKETETLLAQRRKVLETLDTDIHECQRACSSLEAELEDEKSGVIDCVRRTAQLHNEIEAMNTYRSNLSGQKERLNDKAQQAEEKLRELLTEKAGYQTKLRDVQQVLDELQNALEQKRTKIDQISTDAGQIGRRLSEFKEHRSGLLSEQKVLADMETKREGVSNPIKHILEKQDEGQIEELDCIEGIVADVIRADVSYADAVEAALEGFADALVVNSTSRFFQAQTKLGALESRIRIISLDKIEPWVNTCDLAELDGVIGRMVEFARYDSRFAHLAWNLLGRTLLVESIAVAIELAGRAATGVRFVTRDGQVFDGRNAFSLGPLAVASGLISRKSRLHLLDEEITKAGANIAEMNQSLEDRNHEAEHLEGLCKNLRTSIYEANTEKTDAESGLRLVEQSIQRIVDEQPVIANEIEMLESEISASVQREHDSRQKLEEMETISRQRNEHIARLEGQLAGQRNELQNSQTELADLRVEIGQITEKQSSLRQQLSSLESQLHHARVALDGAQTELKSCEHQQQETSRNVLASEGRISELYLEKEQSQEMSQQVHEQVEALLSQQQETERQLKEKRAEQAELEKQIHEFQLAIKECKVKDEGLRQRVDEELQIDLVEAYENFENQDVDWEAVRQEISELRGKIERLGNVNVDAINEQSELEERFEFLTTQVEDLTASKTQLEHLIEKINQESREKFAKTFEDTREHFQVLFRKLFGGGKADILLDDPDDILESGIEIMAKPPGKEPRSISQLSGGEKTMTALALMFAIFRSKPSPFCFLDEVDAALDEANNERFNMILQDFIQTSQFVIITHSKRTMSIADVLFGVTMQTQGVSKRISVRFEDAEAAVA